MNTLFEKIEILINEFRVTDFNKKYLMKVGEYSRNLLFFLSPIILGAYLDVLIVGLINQQIRVSSYSEIVRFWPILLTLVIYLILIRISKRVKNYEMRLDQLYLALKWMYEDLQLDKNGNSDIRCTLWTPVDSTKSFEKVRLKQIVNYVPKVSRLTYTSNKYRKNKCSGRIRRIARLDKVSISEDNYQSIGLVGKCYVDSKREQEAKMQIEQIGDGENFVDYMVENWNFLPFEATRLTQDRRSYLSVALMNSSKSDILGILFFDSSSQYTFNKHIGNKIQKYLPRIAKLLVG